MKRFSQEFVSREIYYHSIYSQQKNKNKAFIKDYFKQLMKTSQPFEIIDGDTLEFISEVYNFLFDRD